MKRLRRNTVALVLTGLLVCAPLSGGCEPLHWFGPNLSLDLIVPLGLDGAPGLLNPFGMVQAWADALFGATSTGGTSSAPYTTPNSQPSSPSVGGYVPSIDSNTP
jgi:hypothetical protein